jgi:O-methyltransferase involved in polyketide biosynthesis
MLKKKQNKHTPSPSPPHSLHKYSSTFGIFIARHAEILPIHIRSVEIERDASYGRERRRERRERHAERCKGSFRPATELMKVQSVHTYLPPGGWKMNRNHTRREDRR